MWWLFSLKQAKADTPHPHPPPPPQLLCHHTPSAGQKGSFCIPPVLGIDSSILSREKTHGLSFPMQNWLNWLKVHLPTHRPSHPPTAPVTRHLILGVMKQHWSLLCGCVSQWDGLCFYGILVEPEFTWHATICSATNSIYKQLWLLAVSAVFFFVVVVFFKI